MKIALTTTALWVSSGLLCPYTVQAFTSVATPSRTLYASPFAASTLDTPNTKTSPSGDNNNDDDENDDTPKAARPPTSPPPASSAAASDDDGVPSFGDRLANSGMASAAAVATAAVNAAVAMKTLEAPDVQKSYIALDKTKAEMDEEGLPRVYDKDLIEAYWSKERGALNQRWGTFVGKAVPFLTKLVTLFLRDGKIKDEEIPSLSRQARIDLQDLGPTFIKAGQMMSVRPDILPQSTLDELTLLQDSVVPFATDIAISQIERELGGPLGQFFSSISPEPVAAASLAQVFVATLASDPSQKVAIKVQRPNVLGTVSKDLYVLRRAAEVFQGLIERFAPQQRTNYVALLNEWAIGFYTELDFVNEAANQQRLRDMLLEKNITQVTVPRVYEELCTRRILVSEWMDGKKLSAATPEQIAAVTPAAQEAFLTQLFEVGFFHADPHPGNLLLLDEPTPDGAELALIDCGLMASIDSTDRDNMISAVIHLANKDFASLVDDFMDLQILPPDSNRAAIIPLMDKALSPYVKGGGAKKYEQELRKLYGMEDDIQSQVGGFQAMTQDALTVLNDIPFSIPPYFAILGRAIVTLEGVALTGNPDYGIIMESYPFIARKLLREGRPEIQKALQEVLYSGGDESSGLKFTRLLALLNNAAGAVSTQEGAAFVDLDSVPEDGISLTDGVRFVLSDNAESLRNLLEGEIDQAADLVVRQVFRRTVEEALVALAPPQLPSLPLIGSIRPPFPPPKLDELPLPFVLPSRDAALTSEGIGSLASGTPSVALLTLREFTDAVAPKLSRDEEIFAIGLAEGAQEFLGQDLADLIKGERVLRPQTLLLLLRTLQLSNIEGANAASVKSVLQFAENAVRTLAQAVPSRRGSAIDVNMNDDVSSMLDSLSPDERSRLDDIVSQLVQRIAGKTVQRLGKIDRVF